MRLERKYLQFNELVFDSVEKLTPDDISYPFKRNRISYVQGHGSYSPNHKQVYVESTEFSLGIRISLKKLPCSVRPFFYDFALGQLMKPGRLWSINNNTLQWAWAEMDTFGESESKRAETLELDVSVTLPEGVWHKADLQKTFLVPWDVCEFMDCYEFRDEQPCVTNCCDCGEEIDVGGCGCCDCLTKDMALCYHKDELQDAYSCNGMGYRFVFDCNAAEKYFHDDVGTNYMGQKMCGECGTIAGLLYSNTVLDSSNIKIRFSGRVKNPYIEINGNGNQIKGEFDDLTIYPDGTATHGCDGCEEIAVEDWVIPKGNEYGWTVHQGNNRVVIETGNCCENVCAYIDVDALVL